MGVQPVRMLQRPAPRGAFADTPDALDFCDIMLILTDNIRLYDIRLSMRGHWDVCPGAISFSDENLSDRDRAHRPRLCDESF